MRSLGLTSSGPGGPCGVSHHKRNKRVHRKMASFENLMISGKTSREAVDTCVGPGCISIQDKPA